MKVRFSIVLRLALALTALAPPLAAQIVVEAEDAVSTNFATSPVLLFGAGNNRTLQLNEQRLIGGSPYYTEYGVYAPRSGVYTFWYGGSLPGAEDPLLASYGSPFLLTVNDNPTIPIVWEEVETGPTYSTPYRWIRAADVRLQEGLNRVRIDVRERRRFDGRYFLYLDRLVFVPVDQGGESAGEERVSLPPLERLRSDPETIEDLLVLVRDNPENTAAWARLADLYTLVNDHINALRYLNRAAVIAPGDARLLQLRARNEIWQGDIDAALQVYWQLLSANPNELGAYLEAGKLAAWNGYYGASEQYYLAGLGPFPGNLEIRINLGFAYLWGNREDEARELFQRAEQDATSTADALLVAREYRRNEAPEEARRFLERRAGDGSAEPEVYAELYDLLREQGEEEAAAQLVERGRARVAAPEQLVALIARVERTYELRSALLTQYEEQAAAAPLDPDPRQTLAQTYLWIGRRADGIRQYEYLLALDYLNGLRRRWETRADLSERGAAAEIVARSLGNLLSRLRVQAAALDDAADARARLDAEDPAAERDGAQERLERTAGELEQSRERIDALISWIDPRDEVSELEAVRDEVSDAWQAVRENAGWEPDLLRTTTELERAQGVLPGLDATRSLTEWLLGEDRPTPAPGILVGSADATERVLLGWAWAAAGEDAAVERALAAVPAAAGRLIVYQELFPPLPPLSAEEGGGDAAGEGPVAPGARPRRGITAEEAQALTESIPEAEQRAAVARRILRDEAALIRGVLITETRLALYDLQNDAIALRTQLGSLYVSEDRIDEAIAQFETVREVDAGNLDTLFALGDAYQQMGRWARALTTYADIYQLDSGYRNVAALHNRIARQNADELVSGIRTTAEPTRVVLGSSVSYLWRVSSRWDARAQIDWQATRLRTTSNDLTRRQYLEQSLVTVGLPLHLGGDALVIEPQAGVDVNGNQLFLAGPAGQALTAASDAGDFFQNWQIEPVLGVAARLNTVSVFSSLSYRYGPYRPSQDLPRQTANVARPGYRTHALQGTLSADFRNRPSPFLSRWQSATVGAVDLISDGESSGERLAVQQDLRFSLVQNAQPFTRISTGLSASFEHFFGADDFATSDVYDVFYRPDEVFQLGTFAEAQLYRGLGRESSWGLAARGYLGLYQERLLDPGRSNPFELESAFRTGGDLSLELTRRQLAFQLAGSLSRVWDADLDAQDFYAVGVSLNVIVRNPRILAP